MASNKPKEERGESVNLIAKLANAVVQQEEKGLTTLGSKTRQKVGGVANLVTGKETDQHETA